MNFFLRALILGWLAIFSNIVLADEPPAPTPVAPAPAPAAPAKPAETVVMRKEDLDRLIAEAAKGRDTGDNKPDPTLDEIEKTKKAQQKERESQDRIVAAAKFNMGLDTFLKEYAGVLPDDANEIAKVATADKYPNELDRASAIKAALIQSFFKEEENAKLLSESQKAKWKAYQSLGTVGRLEEAASMYEIVFEPAVNHARSIRQAKIKQTSETFAGSKDSDIIFKKVHEKQLRAMKGNFPLNDVLHEQAKLLGLESSNS